MKRILSLSLTCLLLLTALSGCASANAAQDHTIDPIRSADNGLQELTVDSDPVQITDDDLIEYDSYAPTVQAALTEFGLELLQQTREAQGTSALISPLSAALALSMAANGADGDTLAQFEDILVNGADLEAVNVAYNDLLKVYQSLGGSTECSIANSLWLDQDHNIREDFVGKCLGMFDAQIFQAELSDQEIVQNLNGWVSEHTNGMISNIIDKPFDETTACLAVNALYLKNRWAQEFDAQNTRERDFTHEDGSVTRMDFLSTGDTSFPYLQGEEAQGAILPYDDGRLAFFVLMPDSYPDALNFEQWLDSLTGEDLSRLLNNRQEDTLFLTLSLPKFTAEWKGNLETILSDMGIEDAFDPNSADFSKLGDEGYYISQVIHATKLEVNEKGTEAAAATVISFDSGSAMPDPEGITLILNRPFLYGIIDLETNVPLFLGTYE